MSADTSSARERSLGRALAQDLFLAAICAGAAALLFAPIDGVPAIALAAEWFGVVGPAPAIWTEPTLPYLVGVSLALLVLASRRVVDHRQEKSRRDVLAGLVAEAKRLDLATGLPNDAYLTEEVSRRVKRIERRGGAIALLHVDIDSLDSTEGVAIGREAILRHVAKIAKSALRSDDVVAKTGGDSFVIVGDQTVGDEDVGVFAERLIERLEEPFVVDRRERRLDVTIGVALHSGTSKCPTIEPSRLIMNAEIALDRAKSVQAANGAKRYEIYADPRRGDRGDAGAFASDLTRALRGDEIEPHYQLVFDAKTQDPVAVEALARWRHPKRGVTPPSEFLPLATELGLARDVDAAVMAQAVADFAGHGFGDHGLRRLSLNVSPARLADESLAPALRKTETRPFTLAFELNEADLPNPLSDAFLDRLAALKGCGVDIDIDDFGAGAASIRTLLEIRPARIKLDRSLIEPLAGDDPDAHRTVKAIVDLATSLGVQVVAKGVATRDHVDAVAAAGVTSMQGFALARPLPADALGAFIGKENWRDGADAAVEAFLDHRVAPAPTPAPASPPTASP